MVAQHYRWDFYGLSTDSKPTATDPKVANGSTYYEADTSKLYVWYNDQWYEKEAGGELPIASASTLGGVKVGEGLSIDSGGVLSTSGGGGEAGAFKELTSADYNYPVNNPTEFALWLLPNGIYHIADANATKRMSLSSSFSAGSTFIVTDNPNDSSNKYLILFGNPNKSGATGNYGIQLVKVDATTGNEAFRKGVVLYE